MSPNSNLTIRIVDGSLGRPPSHDANPAHGLLGAAVVFEGIVRAEEAGRQIQALNYEIYEPMATRVLHDLARDIVTKHGLLKIEVEHSRGKVAVNECSFRLTVHAGHRKEALAAADEFIDRMKKDVPIWKTPVFG